MPPRPLVALLLLAPCCCLGHVEAGTVLIASKKCVLVETPLTFALLTGGLNSRKGDAVRGDFRFRSYVELLDEAGRRTGRSAFVEDTVSFRSEVQSMLDRHREKCS